MSDLRTDPQNANTGTDRGRAMVRESLTKLGAGRSIVVDRAGTAIAGNQTLTAAQDLGIPTEIVETDGSELIAVRRRDLSLADGGRARQLAYADNRTSEVGLQWDADILAQADPDLLAGYWTPDELAVLLDREKGETDPNAAPEAPAVAETQPGDLIVLGRHRLLCGDATHEADYRKLLTGQQPDLVWTDPPYGVDHAGGDKNPHRASYRSGDRLEGDALPAAEHAAMLRLALELAGATCRAGAPWYVAAPPGPTNIVLARILTDLGVWRQTLNWVKGAFVFGRSDYHYRHEPIFYGWKPGAGHYFIDDRTQDSCWEYPRALPDMRHPTMKPVELVRRAIVNSSHAGARVLDPFGGSGTTLIACEQRDRECRMMEIDPKFCDVAVQRWEEFSGQRAQRPR